MLDCSTKDIYRSSYIQGEGICWIWSNDSSKLVQPAVSTFVKDKTLITFQNMSGSTQIIDKGPCIGILDMWLKDGAMTSFDWEFPTDDDGNLVLYAHIFANSLKPTKLVKENPQAQADTCVAGPEWWLWCTGYQHLYGTPCGSNSPPGDDTVSAVLPYCSNQCPVRLLITVLLYFLQVQHHKYVVVVVVLSRKYSLTYGLTLMCLSYAATYAVQWYGIVPMHTVLKMYIM